MKKDNNIMGQEKRFEYRDILNTIISKINEIGKEQENLLSDIESKVELNSIVGTVYSTFGRYDVESIYQKPDKDGHYCMHCNINLPCSPDVEVRFIDLPTDERIQIIALALKILIQNGGAE